MKNLEIFLQQLRDEMFTPYFSQIEIFSHPGSGDFPLRLLARRGDAGVVPHHFAFLHYPLISGSKRTAIKCLGKNCPLCDLSRKDQLRYNGLASSKRIFFYALKNERIAVF